MNTSKKTVVLGASTNTSRYSNLAVERLQEHGHEVVAVGRKKGSIGEITIQAELPNGEIDTITMYLGENNQADWVDKILAINPKRIIFNPGAENPLLAEKAKEAGIEVVMACTLTMLAVGNY